MTLLCNTGITTALTSAIQSVNGLPYLAGFGKPQAVTFQAAFTYVASAATSVDAYVQTSVDGGNTFFDVAEFHFTTASLTTYLNANGDTAVAASVTLTNGTLAANTAINGFLGDRFRVVITSVGTYGASTNLRIDAFSRG